MKHIVKCSSTYKKRPKLKANQTKLAVKTI